jgi:hypothetical protein
LECFGCRQGWLYACFYVHAIIKIQFLLLCS